MPVLLFEGKYIWWAKMTITFTNLKTVFFKKQAKKSSFPKKCSNFILSELQNNWRVPGPEVWQCVPWSHHSWQCVGTKTNEKYTGQRFQIFLNQKTFRLLLDTEVAAQKISSFSFKWLFKTKICNQAQFPLCNIWETWDQ